MPDTTYRVVTQGVAPDHDIDVVAQALAARFELPSAKWQAVLEAPSFVLKRGLSLVAAVELDRALARAGCVSAVEADGAAPGGRSLPAPQQLRALLQAPLRRWRAASPRRKALAALVAAGALGGSLALVVAAGSNAPARAPAAAAPAQAAQAAPAAAPAAATLIGAWSCRSHGPNGFYIRQQYVFRGDGTFADRQNAVQFAGRYRRRGDALVLTVSRARRGATTFAPNLVIDARYRLLAGGGMTLETAVRGSGRKLASSCARPAQ